MRQRLGCLSGTGLVAALITALIIAGFVYARGGLLFNPGPLNAQSGRLLGGVTSHAEIGENCESCHTAPWESETMADRCVVCHTEIATELRSVNSLHGAILFNSPELSCRNCHSEHRGPAAPLTVIEGSEFPHHAVGFSLEGHQQTVAGEPFTCVDCHQDDITTFTTDTCYNCHNQMDAEFSVTHLLTFGASCLDCHDGVDRYGDDFDHNRFVFQLTGRHIEVSCSGCHQNARTIADLQSTPQDCYSCHSPDDPHGGQFGTDCAACHTTEGFSPATFDHNLSAFPLTGRHAELACEQCHVSGQFAGLPTSCAGCHAEPAFHAGVFGLDCAQCHTTDNWFAIFNGPHPSISDEDEGGSGVNHGGASCRDCHTQTLNTATCTTCHDSNNPNDDDEDEDERDNDGGDN